ncbi:hypothetical protein BH11PLA2_BH11PLA2_46480 [soil metagenome]
MMNLPWWAYVAFAGLAWGTYVPIIFYGGGELSLLNPAGKPIGIGGRLASILCVGGAYFVLGVLVPLAILATNDSAKVDWKTSGITFAGLAGVMGALGAICVIFASKAAMDQAVDEGVNPATYRVFIAPLIFCLAPLINTILSLVWHPAPGNPFVFDFHMPDWKLPAGIMLMAAGTFLVLKSKEDMEATKSAPPKPATVSASPQNQSPSQN